VRVVWPQSEIPLIWQCLEILPAQRQGPRPVGSLLVLKLVCVQVGEGGGPCGSSSSSIILFIASSSFCLFSETRATGGGEAVFAGGTDC